MYMCICIHLYMNFVSTEEGARHSQLLCACAYLCIDIL